MNTIAIMELQKLNEEYKTYDSQKSTVSAGWENTGSFISIVRKV